MDVEEGIKRPLRLTARRWANPVLSFLFDGFALLESRSGLSATCFDPMPLSPVPFFICAQNVMIPMF